MILYHGTSWSIAQMILQEGKIKVCKRERSPYQVNLHERNFTEEGYVYLTDDENEARVYGSGAVNHWQTLQIKKGSDIAEEDKWTCIFEINLAKDELRPDINECEIRQNDVFSSRRINKCTECNIENCLVKIKAVRCPRDLVIGEDVLRYKLYHVRSKYWHGEEYPQVIKMWSQC